MKTKRVEEILREINKTEIAVYGDFCIDAYWILDSRSGEISEETGLRAQAVGKHYYTLGGASNVAANVAALEPAHIRTIGVVGDDIFGRELLRQMEDLGLDTSSMVVQKEDFDTVTFGKRYISDEEQPRIDFGFFNRRTQETANAVLAGLETALQECDAVIFNQQVPDSITNTEFIDKVNLLFQKYNDTIVLLDSRHYGNEFKYVYQKTNDVEAVRSSGIDVQGADSIGSVDYGAYAVRLYERFNRPAFITRGPKGIIVADSEGLHEIPGIQIRKKINSVGAGDTITSALALCLAAGLKPVEAADFSNLAAAVTVQKLFQTGTASGPEIFRISKEVE